MSIQELLFFLSGTGFAAYMAGGIALLFRNKWRAPNSYLCVLFFYGAVACVIDLPLLNDYFYNYSWVAILITSVNLLFAPLAMWVTSKLSYSSTRVREVNFVFIWVLLIIYSVCQELLRIDWVAYLLVLVIIICVCLWCRRVWNDARENIGLLKRQESDPIFYGAKWMRVTSTTILFFTIFSLVGRTLLPEFHNMIKLVFDVVLYLPAFLVFLVSYERLHIYEIFFPDKAMANDKEDNLLMSAPLVVAMPKPFNFSPQQPLQFVDNPTIEEDTMSPLSITKPEVQEPADIHEEVEELDLDPNIPASRAVVYAQIRKALRRMEAKSAVFLESDLTVGDLAKRLGTNRTYLSNYFRDNGTSFFEYIESQRVAYAAFLIEHNPNLNAEAIAFRCGFGSRAAFYRSFNNYYHSTPTEYRKRFEQSSSDK